MRYVSLFSGIEAASVAWEGLGWEPVAFSEIDPFPSTVLAHRYPDVPNLGDITQIKWKRFRGKVDLVVGGSPCQSFSIAGKREGLDGASGLMWEYIRAIREIRPRWLLWENVPGALSSSRGEDFRCLLDSLGNLGYGLAWRVLDAQFFGLAQRRKRLFVVGCLGGRPPVEVLFEPESLSGDFETGREERARIAARSGGGAKAAGAQHQRGELRMDGVDGQTVGAVLATRSGKQLQAVVESQNDRTVGALCARDFKGVGNEYVSEGKLVVDRPSCMIRRLTSTECERLQGFPDGWTKVPYRGKPADECPDGPRYKALGNSMAVPVMRWIGARIALAESGSCNGSCNGVSDANPKTTSHQA